MSDRTGMEDRFQPSSTIVGPLLGFAAISLALMALGRRDYPNVHTILDTACGILSALLALILWEIGRLTQRTFARWVAISFAVASIADIAHALVTVEWFGLLSPIAASQTVLRPATWPISSYILPVGVGCSVWLMLRGRQRAPGLAIALLALSAALFPVFYALPRYTSPGWLDITRPMLVGVPPLWLAIGWVCWRQRAADRILPMLALTSMVLCLAHLAMLYSRAPHDTLAIASHLGKAAGLLVLLLGLMQTAVADMLQRIQAEHSLAQANAELESRVAERTRQLQVSSEHTRAVIDTALDGVIVMDHEGYIREFNPAAAAIFGFRRAEVLGKPLADLIVPAALRASHREGLARYLAGGSARILGRRIELSGLRADGVEVPLELSINRMPGDGPVLFAGYIRDLTERHREGALRAEYAAIVESSDDAIVSKTLQGIVTAWNRGAERLFGYRAQEVIGRPMLILFPPHLVAEENDILSRIAHGHSVDHFETVRVRKDGSSVDVAVTISPIKDATGRIVGASKIARDISPRKHAEHKLQMQLARLDLLNQITRAIGERQDLPSIVQVVVRSLEVSLSIELCCVLLYDPVTESLNVQNVGVHNATLARELGMVEHQRIAIDRNGLSRCVQGELVYESDLQGLDFPFPQRLLRGGLRALVAAPLMVEGKVFGVLIAARREPNSFSSGECEFLRQLSEHVALACHQAETHGALQRAYEDLRQTQQTVMQQERLRALGEMASGIAHDINNAISPVALYTESLLEHEEGLTVEGRAQLQVIQRAIEDVAQTVSRMSEFHRHREVQLVLAPVMVNPLLQQVADLTRARWSDMPQKRGVVIELRQKAAPDLPALMGVESEIREALTNLVFNAIDAMPDGGILELRTGMAADGGSLYVEVSDTGTGMDEDTRRRCLDPFFTTKGERGSGLGLAMVYGIAQRHSAGLEIETAPGQGTTIRLTFALASINAGDVKAEPKAAAVVSPLSILLIDDDPLLLQSLRDVLEADGHRITTANGGQQGIDTFSSANARGEPFAVVVTDWGMPHIDGRKVATALKTISATVPVILLSGWGQRLMDEGVLPPHIDYVLSKPPKIRQLREALVQCCGRTTA